MSELSGGGPLEGLKIVECATLFAGPLVGTLLGDYGADVIKVEHPDGDGMRTMSTTEDGHSVWWAFVNRNKRCATLRLSSPEGAALFREMLKDADVLIENFRPGTLERWGLGPEVLHEFNPGLVILRVTGFGQTGPYSGLPGYGTLAEAISGFAYINGWPDKPPALPPFALADSIAALTGTFAVMFALRWRDQGAGAGQGQVIDLSIYEPLFWVAGPQASMFAHLGVVPIRTGNRAPHTAPRNIYRTNDDHWIALSASTPNVAQRVMHIIGHPEILEEPWYASHTGRAAHSDQLDALIGDWIGARTRREVLDAFAEGHGAVAPVYSIEDIVMDPHYAARETIVTVHDPEMGEVKMQNLIVRLDASPGEVRHVGASLGAHNAEVYAGIGVDAERLAELREAGVI